MERGREKESTSALFLRQRQVFPLDYGVDDEWLGLSIPLSAGNTPLYEYSISTERAMFPFKLLLVVVELLGRFWWRALFGLCAALYGWAGCSTSFSVLSRCSWMRSAFSWCYVDVFCKYLITQEKLFMKCILKHKLCFKLCINVICIVHEHDLCMLEDISVVYKLEARRDEWWLCHHVVRYCLISSFLSTSNYTYSIRNC